MKHYRVYGLHLISEFDFVQLQEKEAMDITDQTVWIQEGVVPEDYKFEKNCYSSIDKDVSYLANSTCYMFIEKGKKIIYEKKKNAKLQNLNAYLLGWGIAMICYQRDENAIHCSCIEKDNKAIMISGTSGIGKSSVTEALLKKGYSLVADDMTVVKIEEDGKAYATPSFPYQKLCRELAMQSDCSEEERIYIDENKDKFLIPYKAKFTEKPVPIQALILLGYSKDDKIQTGTVEGVQKLSACLEALFLKGLLKEKLYTPKVVASCLELASKIPIYYILRPRKADTRKEVIENITKLI